MKLGQPQIQYQKGGGLFLLVVLALNLLLLLRLPDNWPYLKSSRRRR